MANNCCNWIQVFGDDLTKAKTMIDEAVKLSSSEGCGWLPKEIDPNELTQTHYLFDVEIMNELTEQIQIGCWTKWSPPIEELIRISAMCEGTEWHCQYEESGWGLYGRFIVMGGKVMSNVYLTDEDLERLSEDEDGNIRFDGELVDSESECIEKMLDEKLIDKTLGCDNNAQAK